MRIAGDSRQKNLSPSLWFDTLHSQGGVHLSPVDLAQQLLDAVFRAKDPDFNVLNERRIRLVNKEVAVNVICLFPSAIFGAAKEQDISHAMAERIVAVLVNESGAGNLGVKSWVGAGDHGDNPHVEVDLHLQMLKVFNLRGLKLLL